MARGNPPPLMADEKTKLAPSQLENNPKIGKGTACISAPKVILRIQHKLQEWTFFSLVGRRCPKPEPEAQK